MKKIIFLLILWLSAFAPACQAQLSNGDIAPDFTATDINGNQWQLYDILDSGKPVYLHFGGVYCACSALFSSYQTLFAIANNWPNDQVILWIESDTATSLADLMNSGYASNVNFPIIHQNGPQIAALYRATVNSDITGHCYGDFVVCRDRVARYFDCTTTVQAATVQVIHNLLLYCPDQPVPGTDAVLGAKYDWGVTCPQTVPLTATLLNIGSDTIHNCTITVHEIGGGIISQTPWSGSLPTYAITDVNLGTYTYMGGTPENLSYQLTVANDINTANNQRTEGFEPSMETPYSELLMEIRLLYSTDFYRWRFEKDDGTWVVWNNYSQTSSTPVTHNFSFGFEPETCYDFIFRGSVMTDDFGGPAGWMRLTEPDGNMFIEINGQYPGNLDSVVFRFKTGTLLGNDIIRSVEDHLSVFPNPAGDMLTIRFDATTDARYEILNTSGQVVMSGYTEAGVIDRAVDIAALPVGIYLCSITLPDGHRKAVRFVHSK